MKKVDSSVLSCIQTVIERFIECLGRVTSWLIAGLLFNVVVVVLLRYVFNISITAIQESIVYLHATIFMLGICYAFQQNAHVSIDFLNTRLPIQWRIWIRISGNLLLLMPFGVSLLWFSQDYVAYSWSLREHSAETDGLPIVFVLKTLIPVLAITLLLVGITDTIQQLKVFRGQISARKGQR